MQLGRLIAAYRWPILVGSLLTMSVAAHAILVFVATRPRAPAPLDDYYTRAEHWTADQALLEASAQLGWRVTIDVPTDAPFRLTARRPVDIEVHDQDAMVSGLHGRLLASRPDETRLDDAAPLVELPQAPGRYRALVRLPVAGLWQLTLDLNRGETRFVHQQRIDLGGGSP